MTDEQKARVLAYVAGRKLSYAVIADLCGTTRNAVGGLVFRDRHPRAARKLCARGSNITGHGWQAAAYRPEKTATNTR